MKTKTIIKNTVAVVAYPFIAVGVLGAFAGRKVKGAVRDAVVTVKANQLLRAEHDADVAAIRAKADEMLDKRKRVARMEVQRAQGAAKLARQRYKDTFGEAP